MKLLLITITLLFSNHSFAVEPVINNATQQIVLGADVQKALKTWDPLFRVYEGKDFAPTVVELFKDSKNEIPTAIIGDFNGDKKNDVALLGNNKVKEIVVLLLAEKKGYKVIELKSHPYKKPSASHIPVGENGSEETGLGFYLGLVRSKDLPFKKSSATTPRDAIQTEIYGGDTRVYYMNSKNKLVEYKGSID